MTEVRLQTPNVPQPRANLPSVHSRDVVALVNETAGRGPKRRHIEGLQEALQPTDFKLHIATNLDELCDFVAKLRQENRLRAVLAVGGDGTVGAALNNTEPGTPICVLPLGTENLLGKYLQMSAKPVKILELFEQGVTIPLDAGRANGRLFALMISAGFDAEVVRRFEAARSGNITRWAYAKPILQAIRSYKYPPLRLYCDEPGSTEEWFGRWVFGLNLPRYARNLPIAPGAVGTDGMIDWCVFGRGSIVVGMWYLWNVVLRRHHRLSSVRTFRHSAVKIESVDPMVEVPYQLDGDLGGVLPVTVEIVPGRLTALVMPKVARQLGFALTE